MLQELMTMASGPYDMWNVIGAAFLGLVASLNLLMLRWQVYPQVMQKAGDDEQKRREAEEAYGRMKRIMIVGGILLVLAGFFLMGPVFRDAFGG